MSEQNGSGSPTKYLLFVWSPSGYTVQEREGEPPRIGDQVDEGLFVSKVGPSPFPGDGRICVYSMG